MGSEALQDRPETGVITSYSIHYTKLYEKEVQQQLISKKMKFYVIDGVKLGNEIGLGPRINVIMQTAFFKISNIIPLKDAVASIKDAIKKSYGKAGEKVLEMNYKAVDAGLNNFFEVKVPAKATSKIKMAAAVSGIV